MGRTIRAVRVVDKLAIQAYMTSYKHFAGSSTTLTASTEFELVQQACIRQHPFHYETHTPLTFQSLVSTMIPFLYPYYQFLACLVALGVMYLIISSFLRNSQAPSEIRAPRRQVNSNYLEAQGLLAAVDTELKQLHDKVLNQLAEVQSGLDEASLTVLDQGMSWKLG